MLRKIITIRNLGRFLNYAATGDVELKRYNLVFAENGRGKTTLCAILRSLQSGDIAYILGRATLGTTGLPEINILLEDGAATFENSVWSGNVPDLAIFDSTFVSKNVYSGDSVDLSHKRNLYKVIVGEQGVHLAREEEQIDAAIREKNSAIREKRALVQALVPHGMTIEAYLSIEEDTEIVGKIDEKVKEVEAIKQADIIRRRAALSELTLPILQSGFVRLLSKTIDSIAEDAERQVVNQIKAHAMHERGESWLSEGLDYIRNDACPFCGQNLHGVTLISAYKAYFSEAYKVLHTEIIDIQQRVGIDFGDREIARIESALGENTAAIEFWSRYCAIQPPTLDSIGNIGDTLRTFRNAVLTLLFRKEANPLEQIQEDEAFADANSALVATQEAIANYNDAVRAINVEVEAKRAATVAADVGIAQGTLILLQAIQKRHELEASTKCRDYMEALTEKRTLEKRKVSVKEKLDTYTEHVIGQYEETINGLLDDFHAGFQITGTSHGYPGGVASSSYQILINDTAVDLGDSSTPLDRPSFKNTVSSGDKSTLALAFFLAQLEHDQGKASKSVVFDDPFNSQDQFRQDCTIQKIIACGDSCSQVIVLSHNKRFLRRLWGRLASHAAERKSLKLIRVGLRNTTITEWDVEQETQSRFDADQKALAKYCHAGENESTDIVVKIRPVLETHCRNICIGEFTSDTLGAIIGKVRDEGSSHKLYPLLNKLDALNEYSQRYHHGENSSGDPNDIDDNELQGFVRKTLEIVGVC